MLALVLILSELSAVSRAFPRGTGKHYRTLLVIFVAIKSLSNSFSASTSHTFQIDWHASFTYKHPFSLDSALFPRKDAHAEQMRSRFELLEPIGKIGMAHARFLYKNEFLSNDRFADASLACIRSCSVEDVSVCKS